MGEFRAAPSRGVMLRMIGVSRFARGEWTSSKGESLALRARGELLVDYFTKF